MPREEICVCHWQTTNTSIAARKWTQNPWRGNRWWTTAFTVRGNKTDEVCPHRGYNRVVKDREKSKERINYLQRCHQRCTLVFISRAGTYSWHKTGDYTGTILKTYTIAYLDLWPVPGNWSSNPLHDDLPPSIISSSGWSPAIVGQPPALHVFTTIS